MNRSLPPILTIAGSDSGGGAGIQADLKTIAMLGGYGCSVITALTAQNTRGVTGIHAPDPAFVRLQLDTVLTDIPVAAAKTGMLFSSAIIATVAERLGGKRFPLVVDPVCVSQSGQSLLEPDALDALRRRLLPLADLLTPNIDEAELLTGLKIASLDDAPAVIERLLSFGAKAVLLKGGHLLNRSLAGQDETVVTDWLGLPGQAPRPLTQSRVDTPHVHGTGCTLAAAIATGLGLGLPLEEAVAGGRRYLHLCLRAGFEVGAGAGPVNHSAPIIRALERHRILDELARAGREMTEMPGFHRLIPEVRLNIGLAIPWAEGVEDVAAFAGRITCDREGRVMIPGRPTFGASSHIAKVVLAAARVNPEITAAVNIRCDEPILAALDRAKLTQVRFDRAKEPAEVKEREGSTLEWGTLSALSAHPAPGRVDAVVDLGEVGKEPMIRVLGHDMDEVLGKLWLILKSLEQTAADEERD